MTYDNRVPAYESLLEFQEVYLRAIALSWKDEKFKDALKTDTKLALERYFGYKCPWNINIKVSEAGENHGWEPDRKKWNLPKNTITFGVPTKPNYDEQAVALAAYNDAGPTFLFSCC